MAPKKAQKMSLNEFLGDSTLGSWADEMDSLPTAPAARSDDARPGDRRRDDFLSSRPDRAGPPREDLPLPTEPPYTAFVGNLVFDLVDTDLEEFFGPKVKNVKIIKDRDDRPKGFGYVEFSDLDGLKEALEKSGASLAGRNIRVSVAEPPKERSGFGGGPGGFDDEKFAGNWRRDGPLPDLPSRGAPRGGRFDGPPSREPPPATNADVVNDWRSSRVPSRAPPPEEPSYKRRGPGFRSPDAAGPQGPADSEDTWSRGSKFKASEPPEERSPGPRFGSLRGGPPRETPSPPEEDSSWRRPRAISRNSTSPNNSTPPTPQLSRRKLELLPRSSANSAVPSPLSSPNPAHVNVPSSRPNPFGAAKPVDVTAREALVEEKIEKGRELVKEKVVHSMSRTSSRTGSQRDIPVSRASSGTTPSSPKPEPVKSNPASANVRPSFSFASAAAGKKDAEKKDNVEEVTEKVAELTVADD